MCFLYIIPFIIHGMQINFILSYLILNRTFNGIEVPQESNAHMIENLLWGNPELSVIDNKIIFEAVADFIISTNRL